MPPKKTTPPPVKVKAGKTKAAPPKVNKPVIIPHRPATAPAEKLAPRRGWKGPPLPFNDIDSALAWGFGDMKVADAEDQADAFKASDAHHRARTKAAEDELLTHSKKGAGGRYESRDLRRAERADNPDAPPIPANVVGGPRRSRAPQKTRPQSATTTHPPAPTPKKEPPPAPSPNAPKKEPPPAPAGPKKDSAPESPRPSVVKAGETPAVALSTTDLSRRAAEKAEEASMKEEQFREEKALFEEDLAAFRASNATAKKAMPAKLKQRQELYTDLALKKLITVRVAAEKQAAETLLAHQGVTQRKAKK